MTQRGKPAVLAAFALFLCAVSAFAQECAVYDRFSGPEGFGVRRTTAWWGSCVAKYVDTRDGNEYVVRIRNVNRRTSFGERAPASWGDTVMMENLRHATPGSECLFGDCRGHGRVYPVEEIETACPEGWRPVGEELLPWDEEDAMFVKGIDADELRDSVWNRGTIFGRLVNGRIVNESARPRDDVWQMKGGSPHLTKNGVRRIPGETLLWKERLKLFRIRHDTKDSLRKSPYVWPADIGRVRVTKTGIRCGKGDRPPVGIPVADAILQWEKERSISRGPLEKPLPGIGDLAAP